MRRCATPTYIRRMNQAWLRVMALLYDPFLWLGEVVGMRRRRRELVARASGRVLEIGAGTGLNLPSYPAAVDELILAEPEPDLARKTWAALEDGTPVDMASEAQRLKNQVADMDRRIARLERSAG